MAKAAKATVALMKKRNPNFIDQNTSKKNETLNAPPASSKKTQKNHMTCLGWIDRNERQHQFVVRPFHKDLDIVIFLKKADLRNHDLKMHAIVRVALRRLKGHTYEGSVLEVFESLDDAELERQIVVENHGIPTIFSERVLKDAEEARNFRPGKRVDLTHSTIVTIDGETAKDFDDAIGVERTKEGNFRITVSIADVSHYVREGTALNNEALLRATSVYLPQFCYPMLPEILSNDLCSLVPYEERPTLTCEMVLEKNGSVSKSKIYPSIIRSQARLTYTTVAKFIETGKAEPISPKIATMLEAAVEASQILRKSRSDRGALDLDLPEAEIVCDKFGNPLKIGHSDRNEAHKVIEDLMILANEQVSEAIEEKGFPSVYRIHEDPDPLKLDRLRKIAKKWGFTISDKRGLVDSLQGYLDSVRGHQSEKTLVVSLLRSLKQAQYSPTNLGHFGLASKSYCHFTSPIRRYPDLMIHRILRKSDFLKSSEPPYDFERLEQISKTSSEHERRAFLAERDLEDMKKCRFMQPMLGKTFDAVITSVKSFGFFVEIMDFPVEGLVPVRTLPYDDWNVDELETTLKGYRKKGEFSLGDVIKVQLSEVDRYRAKLTFRLVKGAR